MLHRSTVKTNKQLVSSAASFPYLDPVKVKGDPSFISRLAELARLEAETIRSEQAKLRLIQSSGSRPSSARSVKSSISSVSSKFRCQSNHRMNASVSTSRTPAVKRLNSTPALRTYTPRSSLPSTPLSIDKQLSCSDLPTGSRKCNVTEVAPSRSNFDEPLLLEDVKLEESAATDSIGGVDDDLEVQRPCSPPIVFITTPAKCSWSEGEGGVGDGNVVDGKMGDDNASGKAALTIRENATEDSKRSDNESVSEDVAKDDCFSSSSSSSSSVGANQDSRNSGVDEHIPIIEDDLRVTSDLGLSIDSLHLSQEECSGSTTMPASELPCSDNTGGLGSADTVLSLDGLSVNREDCETNSGTELENSLMCGTEVATNRTTATNYPRKTRKKGCKKSTKLSSSSSRSQLVSSSSSASLKGSKSNKRTCSAVKKSRKKQIK